MRLAKLSIAAGLLLIGVGIPLLYAGWYGQLDWVATPDGHVAVYFILLALTVTVLACLGMRTVRRDRRDREAREWDEIGVWEEALQVSPAAPVPHTGEYRQVAPTRVRWWHLVLAWAVSLRERPAVRRITDAEMDAEADRIEDELRANAMPEAVQEWPTPLDRREHERAYMIADAQPLPVPMPARWLGPARPIAEVDTYRGDAAWFETVMRAGEPVQEYAAIAAGLSRDVVDAPVSPAAPPNHRPRHAYGLAEGTETQRLDPAFVICDEVTGSWPVYVPELVGAS